MYTVSRLSDNLFKHSISYIHVLIKIKDILQIEIHLNGYESLVLYHVFKLKLLKQKQTWIDFFAIGHGAKSFDFDY